LHAANKQSRPTPERDQPLSARNRQDLTRVLVSYRTFPFAWAFWPNPALDVPATTLRDRPGNGGQTLSGPGISAESATQPLPGAVPKIAPAGVQTPPLGPEAASAASQEAYKPGALAVARAAPKDANALSDIPPDSVGGFVYEGGPMPLSDIRSRGVRYAGPAGVELQGWLKVKQAGRYQLGTDLTVRFANGAYIGPTCFLQAWLEGRSLDQRSVPISRPRSQETTATATLVLGAELQPGLYRLRVWTTCTAAQGVTITSELLLKAPSELNLRAISGGDLLHREG